MRSFWKKLCRWWLQTNCPHHYPFFHQASEHYPEEWYQCRVCGKEFEIEEYDL